METRQNVNIIEYRAAITMYVYHFGDELKILTKDELIAEARDTSRPCDIVSAEGDGYKEEDVILERTHQGTIPLSWDNEARLTLDRMPLSHEWYDRLQALRPAKQQEIWTSTGPKPSHRFYQTFGVIPKRPSKGNFMFSDGHVHNSYEEIPSVLVALLHDVRQKSTVTLPRFNQMVVNWFDNGDDYIPRHMDATYGGLQKDAGIWSLTLMPPGSRPRYYDITRNNHVRSSKRRPAWYRTLTIPTLHGTLIGLHDRAIDEYVHGIRKDSTHTHPRISVSFRFYRDQ